MFSKKKEDIEDLKFLVPIQYYAETVLGLTDWRQVGSTGNLVAPKIQFKKAFSDDMSSLVVDLEKNCFWRNSGKGINPQGSIIDFIMNTSNVEFDDALGILVDFANTYLADSVDREEFKREAEQIRRSKAVIQEVKEFRLPARFKNNKRVFAYLCGCPKRMLEPKIVGYMLDNGYLYQSFDCKCVFVSYKDEIPVFACIRDTDWEHRITYGVSGSLVDHGWWLDNNSSVMVVTEAVVDALAYMSLLDLKGQDFEKYNYLALTGCKKLQCIKHHLEEEPDKYNKIILAFDNDEAGETATKKAIELLKELKFKGKIVIAKPQYGKDINDDLIQLKKRRAA